MITIVFASTPNFFGYNTINNENRSYSVQKENGNRYIWYTQFPPSIIDVYDSLLDCDKKKIILFDQIKGWKTPISIKDHINISGFNGLIGQTPFKSYPMFPDMSSVYKPPADYTQKTVFTVGNKRFNTEKGLVKIISENTGIITPILNYIGHTVTAFGIPEKTKNKRNIVEECIRSAKNS